MRLPCLDDRWGGSHHGPALPVPEPVPTQSPTVIDVCPEHCAATMGGLLILIIKEDPRPSIFEQQRRWIRKLKEVSPDGSAFLAVLQSDTPPPTEEARLIIKRVFREFGQVMKAGAMVIEGDGFVAATFRSVLSMLVLALRPAYPLKVYRSVAEASVWVLPHIGKSGRVSGLDVVAAVEQLKAGYREGTLRVDPASVSKPPPA
ncbi:MAG: hypothetical protein SFV15_09240 [Polyangiaceae bacterium]|nr:hypothetical protein [Polyangiaceae bacterium]